MPDGATVATYGRTVRAGGATFALEQGGEFEPGRLDSAEAIGGTIEPPAGPQLTVGAPETVLLGSEAVPIVPCTIARRSARCLLDTGANPSALALPFAESLRLEPRGELEMRGFAAFLTGYVEAGPLVLGPAHFERVRLAVIPAFAAIHFDAVIGADLLARLHLVLDRRAGTATVGPSAATTEGADLTFQRGRPMLRVTLSGEPQLALVDTGDEALFSLGYASYREGHQWPVTGRLRGEGLAGSEDAFAVEIPDVRIGGFNVGATRTIVRRTQEEAHVGIGLWTRCALELDEAAARFGCAGGAR
ncbi:MAG: hypothetical protein JOZ24_08945, partial [Candidatus Eremiobacteraeota bacterium]|nr:hypothetical protein [Candidatus Eremiobacteraeota bacterium]